MDDQSTLKNNEETITSLIKRYIIILSEDITELDNKYENLQNLLGGNLLLLEEEKKARFLKLEELSNHPLHCVRLIANYRKAVIMEENENPLEARELFEKVFTIATYSKDKFFTELTKNIYNEIYNHTLTMLKLLNSQKYDEEVKTALAGFREGNADSIFDLAVMYQKGDRLHKNSFKAKRYLEIASDLGNPKAQYYLGLYYYNEGNLNAARLIADSANKGFAPAKLQLVILSLYGYSVAIEETTKESPVKLLEEFSLSYPPFNLIDFEGF